MITELGWRGVWYVCKHYMYHCAYAVGYRLGYVIARIKNIRQHY